MTINRSLKIYDGDTLKYTINLNDDMGHIIYHRIDVREEIYRVENSNDVFYKSIYRPNFILVFNDATVEEVKKIFLSEQMNFHFVIEVNGFEYNVIKGNTGRKKYHPHLSTFAFNIPFISVNAYDSPGTDFLYEYDLLYMDNMKQGLKYGSSYNVPIINSNLSKLFLRAECDGELIYTLNDKDGNELSFGTLTDRNTVYCSLSELGYVYVNILGNEQNGITITKIQMWGV